MIFPPPGLFALGLLSPFLVLPSVSAQICSAPFPTMLEEDDNIAIQAVLEGSIPTKTTDAFRYNMDVMENFPDRLYFLDQLYGIIYEYAKDSTITKVFDMAEDFVSGVDFGFNFASGFTGYKQYVHSMSPGVNDDEVYVVFSSKTPPTELNSIPLPSGSPTNYSIGGLDLRTFQRLPPLPPYHKVFVKFHVHATTRKLIEPVPFFAHEQQNTLVHPGGAILTIPDDGRLLWSTGDCLTFGMSGGEGAQDVNVHCGKLLLIDPSAPDSYDVAAVGIRNSQQMTIVEEDLVVFMDIGGVTAEEVNAIPLEDLLDTSVPENFGWGIRAGENFAREGTFKVEPGEPFFPRSPPCISSQSPQDLGDESDFIKPWLQYNRENLEVSQFGIVSFVV
uniref:Uncharacterized protein n=1 Tax=Pseudictyota dubia TaxID=2749911 RepID=A0A7R9WAD7_9STRA|mmetsp:Transcript_39478/g.72826  ORF Transcript_39478/g.72826 Transcript_39478/m.72826 type:complete len:389 (+) Transcript_39478:115-1281(+)